jgi:hypothetical protein
VLKFDSADTLRNPTERVIDTQIRRADLGDQLFQCLAIDWTCSRSSRDFARRRAGKLGFERFQKLHRETGTCSMVTEGLTSVYNRLTSKTDIVEFRGQKDYPGSAAILAFRRTDASTMASITSRAD